MPLFCVFLLVFFFLGGGGGFCCCCCAVLWLCCALTLLSRASTLCHSVLPIVPSLLQLIIVLFLCLFVFLSFSSATVIGHFFFLLFCSSSAFLAKHKFLLIEDDKKFGEKSTLGGTVPEHCHCQHRTSSHCCHSSGRHGWPGPQVSVAGSLWRLHEKGGHWESAGRSWAATAVGADSCCWWRLSCQCGRQQTEGRFYACFFFFWGPWLKCWGAWDTTAVGPKPRASHQQLPWRERLLCRLVERGSDWQS